MLTKRIISSQCYYQISQIFRDMIHDFYCSTYYIASAILILLCGQQKQQCCD
jgi:hypothetical protein